MGRRPAKYLPICFFLLCSGGYSQAIAFESSVFDLPSIMERVFQYHPETEPELFYEKGAIAGVDRLGAFPDPRVSVGRENMPLSRTHGGSDSTQSPALVLALSQDWPWPGSREREKHMALARVNESVLQTERMRIWRAVMAGRQYLQRVLLVHEISLLNGSLLQLEVTLSIVESRRKRAIGMHGETFLVSSEMSLLKSRIAAKEAELRSRDNYLATILGQRNEAVVFDDAWPPSFETALQGKNAKISREDSSLAALTLRSYSEDARLAVARDVARPTLSTSLSLMRDDQGMLMAGIMLGFRLPVFVGATVNAAEREWAGVASGITAERDWYEARKDLALIQSRERMRIANANIVTLSQNLLPLVLEHERLALSDFAAGRLTFASLLDIRKRKNDVQLAREKALRQSFDIFLDLYLIELGFVDEFLNLPFPLIEIGGMEGMTGDMAGAGGMAAGVGSKSPSRAFTPSMSSPASSARPPPENGAEPTGKDAGGMSGMGGM